MRSAPPKVCLRAVSFDAHAFQNLARTHVEELHVRIRIALLQVGEEGTRRLVGIFVMFVLVLSISLLQRWLTRERR